MDISARRKSSRARWEAGSKDPAYTMLSFRLKGGSHEISHDLPPEGGSHQISHDGSREIRKRRRPRRTLPAAGNPKTKCDRHSDCRFALLPAPTSSFSETGTDMRPHPVC